MRALVLGAALAAASLVGCAPTGYAVDLDVSQGCAAGVTELRIDVALTPPVSTNTVDEKGADLFPGGHRHVVVVPPAGTTALAITVRAIAGATVVSTRTLQVTVAGTEIDHQSLALDGCTFDGGVPDGRVDGGGATHLDSLSITPVNPQLPQGTKLQLLATGKYSDNTVKDLTAVATWSVKGNAATISKSGLLKTVEPGLVTVEATVAGITGADAVFVTNATLQSIVVEPANPTLAKGSSEALTATGYYSDNSTQDLSASVQWSTGDGTVATVAVTNGKGVVTAVGAGTTSVTASDPASGKSGATMVTVTAATLSSLSVTPVNPSLAVGTSVQLDATATYSDTSTQDVTAQASWTSSDPNVATVSLGGQVVAKQAGACTISATLDGVGGSTAVAVTPATLSAIAVMPASATVAKGNTLQLKAIGTYSDMSTQDITTQVTWGTSDGAIATVSNAMGSQGLASALTKGMVTVTATSGNVAGSGTLDVTDATLTSIVVTPANPSLPDGTTLQLMATGVFSDNTTQDLTATATWMSASLAVASVGTGATNPGLLTGNTPGTTTISAASGQVTSLVKVTVTNAVLMSIAVTPAMTTQTPIAYVRYAATGTYSDNTTHDITRVVTWNSSNDKVAKISNSNLNGSGKGLATVLAEGTAMITAGVKNGPTSPAATLTATPPVPTSYAISPVNASVQKTSLQQYKATLTFSDHSTQDQTGATAWSSSKMLIATFVGANLTPGLCHALLPGNTTITGTFQQWTATTTLTVTP